MPQNRPAPDRRRLECAFCAHQGCRGAGSAKLVAGREKDRAFSASLIGEGLVQPETLVARIRTLSGVEAESIDRLEAWVRRQVGRSS